MLKFAKFIGANTDFATAQAFLFPRVLLEDSNEPVFGLVITGEGDDIFVKVRQKILNLEENFSSDFERVTDKLHELSQTLKTELTEVENLKFTLFCARENVFYVLQSGNEGEFSANNIVEIFRDGGSFPVVSESVPQEKVVSGFIKQEDRVLILSAKPGEANWNKEVVSQVFSLPLESINDSEMIFAQDELKAENQEDLAGVKNIQPVAFILIENRAPGAKKVESLSMSEKENSVFSKPKINLKFKLPNLNILLHLRSVIRRLFGLIRVMNKKVLLTIVILLLMLIMGGSIFLYIQNRQSTKNQKLENLISSAQNHLNQAQNIKDSDSKVAINEINQAKSQLIELLALDEKNSQIQDLKNRVDAKEAEVLKIYKNPELELFLSLDLIKQNFKTDKLSFSVGKILVLDINDKSLVSIDTKLKTSNILAGGQQLGNAKIASINGSSAFVYSPDKGLLQFDLDTDKLAVVSKPDEGWGNIKDIFGFSNNVYVLDTGKNMIWKYAPTLNGFSQKQEYLRSEVDLSSGKELTIDYSVWVLTNKPDILKFTAGNSDFYAISGLDKPLEQIDGLYVPEDMDSVFILDKLNNRILVTKKNGEYLAQYVSPEFNKAQDYFVDEEEKSIYLLIDNKIYKTPLR